MATTGIRLLDLVGITNRLLPIQTDNPLLALNEFGVELSTGKLKLGDGTTLWDALPYFTGGGGSGSPGAPDTGVQFNNAGAFAGDANFVWIAGSALLQIAGDAQVSGQVQAGTVQATTGNIGTVNATDVQSTSVEAESLSALGTSGDTLLDLESSNGESYRILQGHVQTTDDTTPQTLATIPLAANTNYLIYIDYVARTTIVGAGAVGDIAVGRVYSAAKRVGAGAVVSSIMPLFGFTQSTFTPTIDTVPVGNTIEVRITGSDPATTVLWNATITIQSV